MKAYCFVPAERIEEITECGMDLSLGQHYACKVTTNGGMCFIGKLNPRDYDKQEFTSGKALIKVDLSKVRSFIGESTFFKCDATEDENFRMFEDSLLPSEEYRPGMYRNPLCLIVNAVLPEAVEGYDRLMDEAIPYETSEELYVQCMFEDAKDKNENFREKALIAYFDELTEDGKAKKVSYRNHNVYTVDGTPYILRKG